MDVEPALCAHRVDENLHPGAGAGNSGKLIWAGRAWVLGTLITSGPSFSDPRDQDHIECKLLGIPLDSLIADPDLELGVWAGNVDALQAFLDVTTQFTKIAMPDGTFRVSGLNYPGAQAAWTMAGVTITPDLFAQVQLIERGALAQWSEG